jgi:phosphotriesterase-related protein
MTRIATATGDTDAAELGITLAHEHLFINLMRERRGDGLLNDPELMAEELSVYAAQGGRTVWDLTTAELTPGSTTDADPRFTASAPGDTRAAENVLAVARLSETTGVNVVLGTGHYRDPFLDRDLIDRATVQELSESIVRDLREGFPGTNVRAAIIGEVGADQWFVSATEERSFRAAAQACVATNAPLYTHAARWPVGHAQLDILFAEGVDPSRVVIGHTDTVPDPGYALSLVERGVYVGFDTINSSAPAAVRPRIRELVALVEAGFGDRIVLGHDVCLSSQLRAFGGNGFGFVLDGWRTQLLEAGISAEQFDRMTIDTPRAILTGE